MITKIRMKGTTCTRMSVPPVAPAPCAKAGVITLEVSRNKTKTGRAGPRRPCKSARTIATDDPKATAGWWASPADPAGFSFAVPWDYEAPPARPPPRKEPASPR
ncbi:hypothetical protein Maq22A_c09310 [Methylobacterium aquaticum]|uniref:Uncharacterized protein n=1 Tax=Methylobacterium aquaticum TaxID=270351 RepID=A0A0C6FE59_9HYPH|nr:hypothetical protein Maq22A_c09310 [Methylobacterium aquaticum]